MHIPDGYLSPSTCAMLYGASTPFWYIAVRRLKRVWNTQVIPLLSVFAAFSFVVMMFNLPLPGGTTGHAVGVSIAAIVLGPWASMLAVSVALLVQAVFFGDGGITALGANCFNMAIVGSLVAYPVYRMIAGRAAPESRRRVLGAAIAGYAAINVSALCAAVEFGIQPLLFHDASGAPLYAPYPLGIAIPAMLVGHLTFAGLAELILSGGVLAYLQRADLGLLRRSAPHAHRSADALPPPLKMRKLLLILGGLVVLTPLGMLVTGTAWGEWLPQQFAKAPPGLERLFGLWKAPVAQYSPAFVRNAELGYFFSAALGVSLILLAGLTLRWLVLSSGDGIRPGFVEQTVDSLLKAAEHAFYSEELARTNGLLQRMDPRVKMAGMVALIISVIVVHRMPVLIGLLLLATLLGSLSRVGFRMLATRIWLPVLAFTGLVALPAIFTTPGFPFFRLPLLGWTITSQGVMSALRLILRAGTATTLSVLLVICTPWAHVLKALRIFRLPAALVVLLGMTYRYIFVLLQSAHDMFESRQSRLVGPLESQERRRIAASSAGVLLSKSFQLSSDVHLAMQSRGFSGDVQILDDLRLGAGGWVGLAAFLCVAAAAIWCGR